MSTDLTIRDTPATPDPFQAGSPGGDLIREAAALWGTSLELARAICGTAIVPAHFRGKPEECAAAMVYGATLGLDPIGALRGLYNVHGSVAMYAQLAVSIVMRDGHDLWIVESTDQAVTAAGRRKGWPEDRVFQATWDYARAQRAGYTTNKKYESDPQAMLGAKAQMEVARRIAPDSLNGIYSVEELTLEPSLRATVESAAPRAVTASTFAVEAPAAADAPGNTDAADGVETGEAPTRTAVGRMFAAFGPAGFDSDARTADGKAARVGYMSRVLGRDVESTSDLTAADVDRVTDALVEDAAHVAGGDA